MTDDETDEYKPSFLAGQIPVQPKTPVTFLRRPPFMGIVPRHLAPRPREEEFTAQKWAAFEAAVEYVARRHRIPRAEILGRRRLKPIAKARRDLYVVLVHTLGMSLPEAGALMGRDHTTVLDAVQERERELRAEHEEVA